MSRNAYLTALASATVLVACSEQETNLELRAFLNDGEPLAGLVITALPFDPDRLLDSLASASSYPRPEFPELESEMAGYQRPDQTTLVNMGSGWRATYDSVQRLADSLNQVSPRSPAYSGAYEHLRQLYQRLAQRAVERDAALREQIGEDRELATRAAAAADSLRAWQNSAYADFAELADSALARAGRERIELVTDREGIAEVALERGAWWLIARRPNGENPFMEYYWNVPLVVNAMGPRVVPLYSGNVVTRWRH
jgi:hypothetical protein